MFYSICKKCGKFYHDSVVWANNCICPNCGANDWEDG